MLMQVVIFEGACADEIRRNCYYYLMRKYRKEKMKLDRDLCEGQHGRTIKERVQLEGSGEGVSGKSEKY